MLLGCTGMVFGGTGPCLVVLDQNTAVLIASVIWFQKIFGLHGLNHQSLNTGSVEGGTGWYSVVLGQNRAVLVASMTNY